jgi:hypothetical protein
VHVLIIHLYCNDYLDPPAQLVSSHAYPPFAPIDLSDKFINLEKHLYDAESGIWQFDLNVTVRKRVTCDL